jgi:hypothetical protein
MASPEFQTNAFLLKFGPHWYGLQQTKTIHSIASAQPLRHTIANLLHRVSVKTAACTDPTERLREGDLRALDSLFVGMEATVSINNALRRLEAIHPEPSWDDLEAWGGRLQPLPAPKPTANSKTSPSRPAAKLPTKGDAQRVTADRTGRRW